MAPAGIISVPALALGVLAHAVHLHVAVRAPPLVAILHSVHHRTTILHAIGIPAILAHALLLQGHALVAVHHPLDLHVRRHALALTASAHLAQRLHGHAPAHVGVLPGVWVVHHCREPEEARHALAVESHASREGAIVHVAEGWRQTHVCTVGVWVAVEAEGGHAAILRRCGRMEKGRRGVRHVAALATLEGAEARRCAHLDILTLSPAVPGEP
mmetsp:Transcript_3703/g.9567  ORF Transcript_3703/g.9567 Transcript_3703/m.9567 type:complete len:214 (-) Transcript_3703:166-807(-)